MKTPGASAPGIFCCSMKAAFTQERAMAKKKTASAQEIVEATARLKARVRPGDTVYTILRNVSSSGMSREISLVAIQNGVPFDLTYNAGIALGMSHGKRGGLILGGCGMDMGHHLVHCLAMHLFGGGYACLGDGACPSNYHMNYRRQISCGCPRGADCSECDSTGYVDNPAPDHFDLTHTDGYALRHHWL